MKTNVKPRHFRHPGQDMSEKKGTYGHLILLCGMFSCDYVCLHLKSRLSLK